METTTVDTTSMFIEPIEKEKAELDVSQENVNSFEILKVEIGVI